MRRYIHLVLLLLCLSTRLYAQTSLMEKKVSLQYREVEIINILKDLNKRYNLKFSYSNNIVPEKRKVNINIKNVMLKDALNEVFYETGVAFQVVGEQIVLKKGLRLNTSVKEFRAITIEAPAPVLYEPYIGHEDLIASNTNDFIVDTVPDELNLEVPLWNEDNYSPSKKELRKKYKIEKKILKAQFFVLKDSLKRRGNNTLDKLEMKYNYVAQKMKQEFEEIKNSSGTKNNIDSSSASLIAKKDSAANEAKKEYIYRPFQFSFLSPVGTNGQECGKTVNSFSINLLGGYSAGLMGLEMGGIANVEKDFVKGIQMAGVANVVGNTTEGIQLSGFANICGDSVKGIQAAGFINTVNGTFNGLQGAGFCNINSSSLKGIQGAGFINVIQDSLSGIQLAGFANINNGNTTGIQAAGFINTAKKVKGMQIGVINIADTIQGIPVGLISIVRKGGYRKLDLFATEALYANIAYKIGVRRFYNIFQTGAQLKDDKFRWAMGFGAGTEIALGKKMIVNIEDVISSVWEPDMSIKNHELNTVNRLSANFGLKLSDRTAVYIGPALNVMVSEYMAPDKTSPGSSFAPYSFYDHTDKINGKDVNLKMWIGLNAGIRF